MALNRRSAVVEYPLPISGVPESVYVALETLRATVGLASSLLVVPLLMSHAGEGFTAAGAGTAVLSGHVTADWEDARIDQMRLVGYGSSSGSGDSVRLVAGATTIVTASLASGAVAHFVGSWTVVARPAGDVAYSLQVVGNGVRTQTLHRVELQMRTLRLAQR